MLQEVMLQLHWSGKQAPGSKCLGNCGYMFCSCMAVFIAFNP